MGNEVPLFRGDRLQALRKKQGKTQGEVAKHLGYNVRQYREWETNGKLPSTTALLEICKLFDVDSDFLLGRIDGKTHDAGFVQTYTGLSEKSVEILHHANEDPLGRAHVLMIDRLLSSEHFHSRVVSRLIETHSAIGKLRNEISNEKERRQFIDQFNHSRPTKAALEAFDSAYIRAGEPFGNDIELRSLFISGIIGAPDSRLSEDLIRDLRLSVFDLSNAFSNLIDELLNTNMEIDDAEKLLSEQTQHIIDVYRLKKLAEEAQQHGNDDEENE